MDLIYLYCATKKEPELKDLTLHTKGLGAGVYFVYQHGLYAVVSKVVESEFSEENLKKNLASLEWVKEKVTIHEKVIEGVMKNTCIIPFKFATLFNTEDSLKAMLEKHGEELKENLNYLEGKEEWGLKIYCDMEKLKEDLPKENEELLKIDKEIDSASKGRSFFLKKKKEELLDKVVNKKINEYGKESFEKLKAESLQTRINKLLPKEVTDRKDEMILNSAFLVSKDKVPAFINIVEEFKKRFVAKGLFFDCTGPWPTYNFCTIGEKDGSKNR